MAFQKNISQSPDQLMDFDIPEIISGYLAEVPNNRVFSQKSSKLDTHLSLLAKGVEKIDALKSIEISNEEKLQRKEKGQVTEELMPRESYLDSNKRSKSSFDLSEKKKWMSSVKLCSTPIQCENNFDTGNHNSFLSIKSTHEEEDLGNEIDLKKGEGAFVPFLKQKTIINEKKNVQVEELSPSIPMAEIEAGGLILKELTSVIYRPQPYWIKPRRRWTKELHGQFINAITQLGGPQLATPKTIRELMKVDGLTNNEVKSHLQKHRLRLKKHPSTSAKSVSVIASDNMEDNGDDKTEASTSKGQIPKNRA